MENNIPKLVLIPLISIAHGISLALEYLNMKIQKCTLPAMLANQSSTKTTKGTKNFAL